CAVGWPEDTGSSRAIIPASRSTPFSALHRHLPHIPLRLPRRISALLIPLYIGHGNVPVVGEYQSAVACDHVVEQGFLFVDKGFGEAVVRSEERRVGKE